MFFKSAFRKSKLKLLVKTVVLTLGISIAVPQLAWANFEYSVTYRNGTSGTGTTSYTCAAATNPGPTACNISVSRFEYTSKNTDLWQATGLNGGGYNYSALSGADSGDFTLSAGGTLTFASNPDREAPADSNTDNIYVVAVQVDKTTGGTNYKTLITFTITINDVVDESVTITPADTSTTVYEGSTSNVFDFNTVGGESATWALSGTDADDFNLNSTTGVLTWASTPDYDDPTDTNASGSNTYIITITATDSASANPGGANTNTRNFTVTVLNSAPNISGYGYSLCDFYDCTYYYFAAAYELNDSDEIASWTLSGPDADFFYICADYGYEAYVCPNTIFDYERPIDANKDGFYEFTLTATDYYSASSGQSFALEVNNVEDEDAPRITGPEQISIYEGGDLTDTVGLYQVLNELPGTYSINLYGDDSGFFCLDGEGSNRFALRFCNPAAFDDEADNDGNNVFELYLEVYDGTQYSYKDISVTLLSSGLSEEVESTPEEEAEETIIDAAATNKLLAEVFAGLLASTESAVASSGLMSVKADILIYLGLPSVGTDTIGAILDAYSKSDASPTLTEFKDFAVKHSVLSRLSDPALAKGVTVTDLVNAGLLPSGTSVDGLLMLKLRETPLEQRDMVAELQALILALK